MWYSKDIGDGEAASKPTREIQDAFFAWTLTQAKTTGTTVPTDAAVFSTYDLNRNTVTVYFSPSAEPVALGFDATPCEKPVPSADNDFGLLVGDQRAWSHFEKRKIVPTRP